MKNQRKLKTSFTLSAECGRLLNLLSSRFGISKTSIIEMLVRERARVEGIVDVGDKKPQDTVTSE